MEVLEKTITYQEYREMEFAEDDNFQYELLNGILMRKGSPTIQHQRIVRKISFAFEKHIEVTKAGEVFFAPLDVVLNEHNALQPDVIFVGKDKSVILNEEEQVIIGVPDIVVEVLSPGSIKKDRILKKIIYEKAQVPEFWIVDPNNKNVEIQFLKDGKYDLFDFVEETGMVKSTVLKKFELDLKSIFR